MRQRDFKQAEERYSEAAKRAPRWAALHMAWAQALWASGAKEEARGKLRAAAGMDLGRGERERLQRMRSAAVA
jgi:predicted Zn-dependent protease